MVIFFAPFPLGFFFFFHIPWHNAMQKHCFEACSTSKCNLHIVKSLGPRVVSGYKLYLCRGSFVEIQVQTYVCEGSDVSSLGFNSE
jgi:hypothetical protein